MSLLLENQNYRTTFKFVKQTDDEKEIKINLSVQCNHEIDINIIYDIEKSINSMFLSNYIKGEEHDKIFQN